MGQFINPAIGYYEGDRISLEDEEVQRRPSDNHTWNGSAWIADIPSKAEMIASITIAFKADISMMQANWLAAAVTGGTSEPTKKAAILQDISDRKAQYTADVATVRNS